MEMVSCVYITGFMIIYHCVNDNPYSISCYDVIFDIFIIITRKIAKFIIYF